MNRRNKNIDKKVIVIMMLYTVCINLCAQESKIVFKDEAGKLNYVSDTEGNRIPDFSFAGYMSGEMPLPNVPVVRIIKPIAGDNTKHIQNAIDLVANNPKDENGIRGALLLSKGTYEIHGKLYIKAGGVVIRGEGSQPDDKHNTIIYSPNGKNVNEIIINIQGEAAGNAFAHEEPYPISRITNEFSPVNSRSFRVENTSIFKVNDTVIVQRQATDFWMKMIDYGGTNGDELWLSSEFEMRFPRRIVAINDNTIILNQPIYEHIYDKTVTPSHIYKLNTKGFISNVGLENLRVTVGYNKDDETNEDHANSCIGFDGAWNCWAKNVVTEHFVFAGFYFKTTNHITLDGCKALDPKSQIIGGRRYNFAASNGANNILCKNAESTNGRHAYVSNGTTWTSGLVFLNCKSTGTYSSIEGHRRWTTGILYDNLIIEGANTLGNKPKESTKGRVLGLYNRGYFGTGHGWSASHSVVWNSTSKDTNTRFVVQKPPTSQNYSMFSQANVTGTDINLWNSPGYIEGTNTYPQIPSLYLAQLNDRIQFGMSPDPPAKIQTSMIEGELKINWLDNSGEEEGYVIEYSSDGGNNYTILKNLEPNTTAYSVSTNKLKKDQVNYFQIYSIANGRKSARVNFTFSLDFYKN